MQTIFSRKNLIWIEACNIGVLIYLPHNGNSESKTVKLIIITVITVITEFKCRVVNA